MLITSSIYEQTPNGYHTRFANMIGRRKLQSTEIGNEMNASIPEDGIPIQKKEAQLFEIHMQHQFSIIISTSLLSNSGISFILSLVHLIVPGWL